MGKVRCSVCGGMHDLSDVELSYDRPDAYYAVPPTERTTRIVATSGLAVIDHEAPGARYFVRAVIVIPIRGDPTRDGFGWGTWAEVDAEEFGRVVAAGDKATRASEPPLVGSLANELPPFRQSLGLPARVRIQPPGRAPEMDIVDARHPLGAAQQQGVFHEDILEWLHLPQ